MTFLGLNSAPDSTQPDIRSGPFSLCRIKLFDDRAALSLPNGVTVILGSSDLLKLSHDALQAATDLMEARHA